MKSNERNTKRIDNNSDQLTEQPDISVLLILPPLTQLNTPYPSITHLTAYLRQHGIATEQADLGIELTARLLTREMTGRIFDLAENAPHLSKSVRTIVSNRYFYEYYVDAVAEYLRGNNTELTTMFSNRSFWQGMYRLPDEDELEWAYGTAGAGDKAKYLCSLFLKNISDVIHAVCDDRFELIRYGEKICTYLTTFERVRRETDRPTTLLTEIMIELLDKHVSINKPKTVGLSVPFPGNLIGALVCAKHLRTKYPGIRIVMGGGYVNTELRSMTDTGLFDYIDYLIFDDGELPLLRIAQGGALLRTAYAAEGEVVYKNMDNAVNEKFADLPAPTYDGLPMHLYLDFVDSTNPMHRLWSDGKWNKLMLAHGCYWAKCTFCDTTLDYIGRFQTAKATVIADRMESMIKETGRRGFHFVDEAAPPSMLKALAEEIIRRKMVVTYWTNVRFDRQFTPELCFLLARSGCIAVSGGLEVASARLLRLINKGVTIESASECMRNLTDAGIMVHAYLMYGFPTETEAELFESLNRVRDLFADGLVYSAFWHRYAMTCHSMSGIKPQCVGACHTTEDKNPFANNEIPFSTTPAIDWGRYSDGLNLATYNYMRGAGFEMDAREWFGQKEKHRSRRRRR